jgi:hypothetical protein
VYALTYEENQKREQIFLPPDFPIWVDEKTQTIVSEPPACDERACPSQTATPALIDYITGNIHKPNVTGPMRDNAAAFDFRRVDNNRAILASHEPLIADLHCPSRTYKPKLQGIYAVDVPPGCTFEIPDRDISITGRQFTKPVTLREKREPSILPFEVGTLRPREFEWRDFLTYSREAAMWYSTLTDHVTENAEYYLIGGFGIFLFILIVANIYFWPKFLRLQTNTRVYVRRQHRPIY